jgi:tRNA1(Val) A37 N6-methylase TrmN6
MKRRAGSFFPAVTVNPPYYDKRAAKGATPENRPTSSWLPVE